MLAAGALVASLLAVGAAPAAAIDEKSKQDNPAAFNACVGAAKADAGFTDTDGLGAEDDINCLAHYRITTGKPAGSDTFDPNSKVKRSQMALFLYRAASAAGLDLMGGDGDADFDDIDDEGEDRQNAITALARNGILAGRDGGFEPSAEITRAEMAVALVNFVSHASDEVRPNKDTGLFELKQSDNTYKGPNDTFGDAGNDIPLRDSNAISAAYELGITTGTPAGSDTFDPAGLVPRKNMASFIVRALGHTDARPAGVTAQHVDGEVHISVRDGNFQAVVNQTVDVFMISSSIAAKAFKADGTCSSRVRVLEGTSKRCEIDGSDLVTLSDGNESFGAPDTSEGAVTVWLWAGDDGDEYGADTPDFELEVTPGDMPASDPLRITVSTDLGDKVDYAQFSEAITVTLQLQGDGKQAERADTFTVPDNVPEDDYANTGPSEKTTVRVTVNVHPGSLATGNDAEASIRLTTHDLTFGDDGSVSFELTRNDPDPSDGNVNTPAPSPYDHASTTITDGKKDDNSNYVTIRYQVALTSTDHDPAIAFKDSDDQETGDDSDGSVTFSDVKPAPKTVSVDAGLFHDAPASGSAGNAAVVTVKDQFGNPFRGAKVTLRTDQSDVGADVSLPSRARVTGRNGSVRIGYSYEGDAGAQIVTAAYDPDTGDTDVDKDQNSVNDRDDDVTGSTTIFWVVEERHEQTVDDEDDAVDTDLGGDNGVDRDNDVDPFNPNDGDVNVLSLDPARSQLVVDINDLAPVGTEAAQLNVKPTAIGYDSNDYFFVNNTPSGMGEFVEAVAKALLKYGGAQDAAVTDQEQADALALIPEVAWRNYIYDDESERTEFRVIFPD